MTPQPTSPPSPGHAAERRRDVRNVAIIAHVDHGKTTLVDALLSQSGSMPRGLSEACVLDSSDQERERGITILSKICAVHHSGVHINIIDTPGHADFGGEVERVVRLADGCLLLVDAFEGVMPQTRFVLRKALENGLRAIVVVNKVDKDGARPTEVVDEVFDLMVELGAADWQLDFPVLFGSGREGWMSDEAGIRGEDLGPLFRAILDQVPGPAIDLNGKLQLQVANLDHSDFVGRIGIGRIQAGELTVKAPVVVVKRDGSLRPGRVQRIEVPVGLGKVEVSRARAGDLVHVTGLEDLDISDTICDPSYPRALPPIPIDEPTIRMGFGVTTSPLAGQSGKPLQSRELAERLRRETERNVALRVEATDQPDVFEVSGRGLLHLSVLIENMRREGAEFQVGPPRVIEKVDEDGTRLEPYELAVIDVPEAHANRCVNLMLERRAQMQEMSAKGGMRHLEFTIPSRCTFGLRTQLLTATQGEAVLNTIFLEYGAHRGGITGRRNGTIISMTDGEAIAYAIAGLEDRGEFFIGPGTQLYEGMIVGENAKENDLVVNLTKGKKLTNVRSSGADDAVRLTPPRELSLEDALEFIAGDELVEVTPGLVRLRKRHLKEVDRRRAARG